MVTQGRIVYEAVITGSDLSNSHFDLKQNLLARGFAGMAFVVMFARISALEGERILHRLSTSLFSTYFFHLAIFRCKKEKRHTDRCATAESNRAHWAA